MKLVYAVTYTLMAIMVTIVMLELIVGCGDIVHVADGSWRIKECVFIPIR